MILTVPFRYSPAKISVPRRVRGVRKRKLFYGGSFAPPGYDEIIHVTTLHARDCFNYINQIETQLGNPQYQWRSAPAGSGDPTAFGLPNAFLASCFHPASKKFGIAYARGTSPFSSDTNFYKFYEMNEMPACHKPIYINPSHYLPYEITIARFGHQSNNMFGSCILYFYRVSGNQSPFEYQTNTIIETLNYRYKGIAAGVNPSYGIAAVNTTGVTNRPFQIFSQPNTRPQPNIQDQYLDYASNQTDTTLNLGLVSRSFPFPLIEGLLSGDPPSLDPNVRIAILPHIASYSPDSTNLEMEASVMVMVRCKSQS